MRKAHLFSAVLALGHVAFCVFIMSSHFEGSWGGFLLFVVDLPASLPVLLLSSALKVRIDYLLLFAGTAWWFGVGMLISKALSYISRKITTA